MSHRILLPATAILAATLGGCIESDGNYNGDPVTNPLSSSFGGGGGDRDGDGWSDSDEKAAGTNPNFSSSHPYTAPYNVGYCEGGVDNATGPTNGGVYKAGDVAENFSLTDRNGETVELYSFCGQTIMVVNSAFW